MQKIILDPVLNQEMEDEIKLLNTKLDYFEGNLLSAKTKIKTLDENNKVLKYRLTSDKAEIENLKNRIRQLEDEKIELQSHSDRLTSEKNENENLRDRISQLEADKTRLKSECLQNPKEMTNEENRFSSHEIANGEMSGDYGDELFDDEVLSKWTLTNNSNKYEKTLTKKERDLIYRNRSLCHYVEDSSIITMSRPK